MNLANRCAAIKLILTDVDGVLTDGAVILDNDGVETKRFHIRDGLAARLWQQSGGQLGIVTGRSSQVVKLRAAELDIEPVRQGVRNKLSVVHELCEEAQLQPEQVAYLGDDLPDLAAIRWAGLGAAVADAAEEVCAAADYVTSVPGGNGALRELVEVILKNTDRWTETIRKFAA
jgi:YrbI family 3-deoxy-D-manno-octulosonate 8-phosphate phosphatase